MFVLQDNHNDPDANGGNDGENSHDDEKMYILDWKAHFVLKREFFSSCLLSTHPLSTTPL